MASDSAKAEEVRFMLANGLKLSEIAEHFGVTVPTVWRWLNSTKEAQ